MNDAKTKAIGMIRDEHRSIAAVLSALRELARTAQDPAVRTQFSVLHAMIHYIDAFPERLHHPKEEEYLFRPLAAKAPQALPLLATLRAQHEEGARLIRDLQRALLHFEISWPQGGSRFRDAVNRYADFHWDHMRREERELLPLAAHRESLPGSRRARRPVEARGRGLMPDCAFEAPLEMLAAGHKKIEEQLRALERLVAHLAGCGCDEQARSVACAAIRYFDTAGKEHQLDEDENLFPLLRSLAATRGDPVVGATLYELEREHATIDKLYAALRRQLAEIGEARSSRLDAGQVERFAWIHRRHMALEAEVVLPFASASLDNAQRRTLGAAMAARRSARHDGSRLPARDAG